MKIASFLQFMLLYIFLLHLSSTGMCFVDFYPKIDHVEVEGNPGTPLLLTNMLENGKIQEAQQTCMNKPLKGNITSYSGFLLVNKQFNSNMFFWFFPAIKNRDNAPVVLWLQGGPGASSMIGVFSENGPFSVKNRRGLKLREHTWITSHSMLYIDNPLGTGFSFTDDGGYSNNEEEVGLNIYSALVQFFTLFPQYKSNEFYIAGESYAGKFVPAVAHTIDERNPSATLKINLKGLAIGNGFCDPEHMMAYGDYLYNIGFIDSNGRHKFEDKEKKILQHIQQKRWANALTEYNTMLNGNPNKTRSLLYDLTGYFHFFNFMHTKPYDTSVGIDRYLSLVNIRQNLHVGNIKFNENIAKVENHLRNDIMQSVKPWIEKLLEKYRVLIYNGHLDMVVPFPLTESFLNSLRWSGDTYYKAAPRKQWYVEEELAGFFKTAGKLTVVMVRNAGHMVPLDQPKWAVDMITRFTRNKSF